MPIMLPADIGEESFCSNGEKQVFEYLRSSGIDGYVIHSLGFEMFGPHEIDYVVICERGILCLEVKGGGILRKLGEWYYVDHKGVSHPGGSGPYVQAQSNMFMLREKYREHFKSGDISNVQFSYGVVFPDAAFDGYGIDIPKQLTFDRRRGLDEFDSFVKECFDYHANFCLKANGVIGSHLANRKDLESVKNYLQGDFGYLPDLNSQLDGVETRLNRATDEQYLILGQLDMSDKLLIAGGAGTGKTLLAIEHARRLADAGNRVLFLSYNKLIKNFVAHTNPLENVDYDSFNHFLYESAYPSEDYKHPDDDLARFYNDILPGRFYELGGLPEDRRYDALIVDEAQDILSDASICCLDLLVKGGLSKGRVAIFYDANQNIFNLGKTEVLNDSLSVLIREFGFTPFKLSKNCRSTRRIADFFMKTADIPPMPLNSVDGVPVSLKTYENCEDERRLLASTVKELLKDGVPAKDIVVISHMGNQKPKGCFFDLSALKGICSYRFIDPSAAYCHLDDCMRLTTVQSFKGMESKVVIVVDVNSLDDDANFIRPLNYTSFSRAKAHLYVLAHKDLKKDLTKIIKAVN